MPSQNKWDQHWLDVAHVVSNMSKDPSTQVGAVIVTPDNRQCSIGYNGFSAGVEETPDKWERPIKYERVIHAEMNAIMNCPFDTNGCSVYTTITPCHRCMVHLVNAGVKKVVYAKEYDNLCHMDIWVESALLIGKVYQLENGKRKVRVKRKGL